MNTPKVAGVTVLGSQPKVGLFDLVFSNLLQVLNPFLSNRTFQMSFSFSKIGEFVTFAFMAPLIMMTPSSLEKRYRVQLRT